MRHLPSSLTSRGENEVIKYLISENWENWNDDKKRVEESIDLDLVNVLFEMERNYTVFDEKIK
jgi:hypothetical protein